ncbi:hypothetical protein DENIT_11791 [Pseudomonas veronii]|nr:hypothetical protein DENIT_11791 [Pseudomonas veronii]
MPTCMPNPKTLEMAHIKRASCSPVQTTPGFLAVSDSLRNTHGNGLYFSVRPNSQRAAALMSLIQPTKLNGHDPSDYLKDVLTSAPARSPGCCRITGYRYATCNAHSVTAQLA